MFVSGGGGGGRNWCCQQREMTKDASSNMPTKLTCLTTEEQLKQPSLATSSPSHTTLIQLMQQSLAACG